MKKLVVRFLTLLFVLGMSTNAMWAQESTIYLASLKAQTDPASTGSGQVKLTWLDITGKPMWVDLAKQMNYMAFGDMTFFAKDYVYDGFGETAQLEGGTTIAIEGTETPMEIGGSESQIYMTSVIYFHAEAEPENGSYLADWTFTDPMVTRMTSSMSPADPMGDGSEDIPYRTPCFKVLPDKNNSTLYPPMDGGAALAALCTSVAAEPNNIYALFSKYLLSNPVASNAILEAEENATANLTVTVEINGDAASLDAADFATFTFTNNGSSEWAYDLDAALAAKEVVSDQKTRITIPVTYTYKNTGFGLKNTTMTISMAGASPSTLNVNLSVDALNPNRAAAFLLEGKDDASPVSGTLDEILATDISGYSDPILKLNKPVATDLTFAGKNFTLDLNGNTTQAITVSSGNVTIAYSQYVGSATSLTVNGGKAILNGGTFGSLTIGASGTVEQNGATITGAATNNGSLTTTEGTINGGLTSSKTLIVNGGTFKGATAVTVSGGTAAINRGTIEGTTCGLKVEGGAATTKKLAAIKGATYSAQQTDGTLTVESGKFDGPLNGTIAFTAGFFKTNTYGVSTEGKTEMNVSAGVEYNEGYRYFLGTTESALANGVGVCRIGAVSYAKLEDAIAYANNNPSVENIVIFMTNDYTLPAGYYTLPENATIVVPMSDEQEKEVNATAPRIIFNDERTETPYTSIQPTEFRRLTFAAGVNLDMFGDIEVTCSQYASNEAYTAQPVGSYGRLVMEDGSHITLQDGAEFRAWGFVTGKGEMDARRGAKVREMFQLGDWKGAFTSVEITGMAPDIVADHSDKKIFPVTQYFIQNIESPVKYHPGAVLSTSATVSEGLLGMSISMGAPDIAIVGVSGQHQAIFLIDKMADADNTWVRKWYDTENDIQVYDINSAAHIGSMVLDMGDVNLLTYGTVPVRLNSAHFDLPLTSNFKIHLLSGTMDFQQNTSLLPGAVVEVDKGSIVTVAMDETEKTAYDTWVAGGKMGDEPVCYTGALYVYDADDWDKYAYCKEYDFDGDQMVTGTAYTKTVRYAPSWNGRPNVRDEQTRPLDAAINIHGTFKTAEGFVYCSENGANIFSSNEDAGTFVFNEDAAEAGERTVYNVKGSGTFEDLTFYPAKLKNGNNSYANTSSAQEGDAYCYQNNKWSTMTAEDCFVVKHNEETGDIYYAKPQEYVALANGMTPNSDNTYSDAAGAGRLFILQGDCQWWEVEKKDNLYHCLHPDNDTYYYWDEDEEEWMEKKYSITWKNWNDTILPTADKDGKPQNSYEVTYGTMAEFLGTNPTREANIDYTYDFTGWTPALGPVTSDVTYTATFTQKERKYTIIFQQEGGVEIERHFLKHNDVPVCENTPTKVGHTLVWSPAIAAVTGDATYTATWVENPPTEYEITFFDYDGETELKQGNVNVGDMPVPPAQVNGKPATSEYTYVFDHWSPAVEKVSATSAKVYTAVYREVAKTFPVNFYFEQQDAEHKIGATQFLEIGQTPVIPDDERLQKTEDNANVYQLVWTPQIQTVVGHAEDYTYNYVASYTSTPKQYSLTLKCTPSGAAVITGARADYAYEATPTITVTPNAGYNFVGWSDSESIGEAVDGTYSRTVTINGNIELTVVCECPDCDKSTIIWKNEAGDAELATDLIPVGSATIYHGATPTKASTDQYSYTFYGWTTAANEGGTKYKNGMTPVVAAAEQTYTYYACFTPVIRQYNVALSSNIPNVCMLVGAGTYDYSASNNATVIVSGYDAVNYTFKGWYNGEDKVSPAESYSFAVQSDVDLVAKFSPVTYTITWKSENGVSTLETDAEQAYGAATAFNSAEPTKDDHSFIGWTTAANGEGSFYAKGATPAVSGDATYYAYFAANSTSLEIGATGSETLTEATDYTTFTITSNGVNSGQLINANNLSLLGEAIFKLQPTSPIPGRTWYAVAAPWQVDVRTGIYADGRKLNVGVDFDIIEFDAESYATKEAGAGNTNVWRYVEENSGVMQPGKLYMIYLASAKSSLEFHKTGGGISTTTLSLTTTSGSGDKANWNAIANPALYHADLNMTVIADASQDVLQYINGGYTPTTASNMIVGAPIFVQVNNPQSTVNANVHSDASPAPAYRRALQTQTADNRFIVEIDRNGQMNDRLIVQTADEKENTYVIGKDLAKMGVGSKTAQMWMERYNTKLCKNTVEMNNENAEYPLSIYAPAAGEYTLSAMQKSGDADLYLSLNGEAIWNLSDADYTLDLNKGTNANYGLRISVKKNPAIVTGIDEAVVDAQGDIRKVLINDKVFIIRGDKAYSIDGQLVK